ncbi:hypothetical protein FOZ63_010293, partial [Perkinsus olseni]
HKEALFEGAGKVYRTIYPIIMVAFFAYSLIFHSGLSSAMALPTTVQRQRQCVALINLIETTPPEGYQDEDDWIKSFVNGNMAAALSLARENGSVEEFDQEHVNTHYSASGSESEPRNLSEDALLGGEDYGYC